MDTRWTGGHRSARYCCRAPSPEMKAHPGVGCSSAALATDCPGKGLVDTDQLTTAPGPPSPEMTVMGPGVQEAGGALGGGPGADPLSLRPGRRWRPTSEQGGRKQRSLPGSAGGTQRAGSGRGCRLVGEAWRSPSKLRPQPQPGARGLQGKGWSSPGVPVGARSALGALRADGPGWLLTS